MSAKDEVLELPAGFFALLRFSVANKNLSKLR
jgi:hypothetical protein